MITGESDKTLLKPISEISVFIFVCQLIVLNVENNVNKSVQD